jgi:FixJ family two-component response regulator
MMRSSRAVPKSQKSMPEVGMPKKPLISIVDDDESIREAIKGLVNSLGFTAEAFPCAEEFLKSNDRRRTACLIADVQMPGMTGLDLHSHLVASGEPLATILITAYPDERVRARALQEGVICYLTKPFTEDELLTCIRSIFGESGASGKI